MSKRTREPVAPSELAATVAEIHKAMSPQHIQSAGAMLPFNHIPVGPFTLDLALGGGILEGLGTMIYGRHSGGKTTLCNSIIAAVQKKYPDKVAAFIDLEGTYDVSWARQRGVDVDKLQFSQPYNGEEAVDIIAALMDTIDVSLIVVDSIPSMVPFKVLEKSASDGVMAVLPQLMGRLCSKITGSWLKERKRGHWVTLVFTNQWRSKVGGFVLGDPRILPGGAQIMHLNTTHIETRNKEIVEKDAVVRNEHAFKISKAKGASLLRSGEFQMSVDDSQELPVGSFMDAGVVATYARKFGFITGAGSSWKIRGVDGQKFGRLDEIQSFLYSNDDKFTRLKQQIIIKQRMLKGMPSLPPDSYILGPCDDKIVSEIDAETL